MLSFSAPLSSNCAAAIRFHICFLLILLLFEQVFKGETLDGDKVAIKVQYIDLQDRFLSDIKAIIYLLKAISVLHPKFDLQWVLIVSI